MNLCPDEDDLLRYLEGELDVQDDARIVVHVEDCAGCQERLERLTRGNPALGEPSTVEAVDPAPRRNGDPAGTELDGPGSIPEGAGGGRSPGSGGDAGVISQFRRDPGVTRELDDAVDSARVEDTAEATDPTVTIASDPRRDRSAGTRRTCTPRRSPGRGPVGLAGRPRLRDPPAAGRGRDGGRLQGAAPGIEPRGRPEDDPRGEPGAGRLFARFRVEAESVARLRRSHIIQIFDIGEVAGLPFVALELLVGGSLDNRPEMPAQGLVASV